MTTGFSDKDIVVHEVVGSGADCHLIEKPLEADLVPATTSGQGFQDAGISGSNVQEVLSEIADLLEGLDQVASNFTQVNFVAGTNLLVTNTELALSGTTELSLGSEFTVNTDNVTIADPGIYRVSWSVTGIIEGSTGNARRRNLLTDLNRNVGSFVSETEAAGHARDRDEVPYATSKGYIYIQTTASSETVGIRTRDAGDANSTNVTFTVNSGYLQVRLVKKS